LSGNFAVCQGIFAVKCHLHSRLFTEIIINVFLSLALQIATAEQKNSSIADVSSEYA